MKCAAVFTVVSLALVSQGLAVLRPLFPAKPAPPLAAKRLSQETIRFGVLPRKRLLQRRGKDCISAKTQARRLCDRSSFSLAPTFGRCNFARGTAGEPSSLYPAFIPQSCARLFRFSKYNSAMERGGGGNRTRWTALATIPVRPNAEVEYHAGSVSGNLRARISTPGRANWLRRLSPLRSSPRLLSHQLWRRRRTSASIWEMHRHRRRRPRTFERARLHREQSLSGARVGHSHSTKSVRRCESRKQSTTSGVASSRHAGACTARLLA
jgi:hypothetical protein